MKLSVIIPIRDEEDNLTLLCERLAAALAPITSDFEIVFVDDGSVDGSFALLQNLHRKDSRIKALSLSRSFGHQAALTAGLDYAAGDAVVTMDGDLQHPPESIPQMIHTWKNGFEIVHAIRSENGAAVDLKMGTSRFFYWFFRKLTGIALPPQGADFRLYDKKVVLAIREFPERNRMLRGLSAWVGFKATQIPYTQERRQRGRTKYTWTRMLGLAMDGLLSFSSRPLYFVVFLGLTLGFFTFLYVVYAFYVKFVSHQALPGWTSIAVLIGGVGSIQLLVSGLLGLYIGKIYEESKHRPLYLLRDSIDIPLR